MINHRKDRAASSVDQISTAVDVPTAKPDFLPAADPPKSEIRLGPDPQPPLYVVQPAGRVKLLGLRQLPLPLKLYRPTE